MCLQLHSLSTDLSVSGFLGGKRYYKDGKLWLYILRYEPCKIDSKSNMSSEESCKDEQGPRMHCNVPSSSQAQETSRTLRAEGVELLGWFHTHPFHPRKPSKDDVHAQKNLQLDLKSGPDRPLVGLIFSCLDLKMRCIYIRPKDLDAKELIKPYDLEVAITKEHKHFPKHVETVLSAIKDNDFDIKRTVLMVRFSELY